MVIQVARVVSRRVSSVVAFRRKQQVAVDIFFAPLLAAKSNFMAALSAQQKEMVKLRS